MTTLLFYEKPIPLSRDLHLKTRIKEIGNLGYASHTNSIPIAAAEFVDVAREYPIVFTGQAGAAFFPIALVGLRMNENLYVTKTGDWKGTYIPAFVRRYPFVLAEKQGADDFEVYIDEAYPGFGKKDGRRLFGDDGEPSETLSQAIKFLSSYQGEILRTRNFVERIQKLDLLVQKVVRVESNGAEPIVLEGFSVIDEDRLMALEDTQLLDLTRSGYLPWVYAHLMSLGNVSRLSQHLAPLVAVDTVE